MNPPININENFDFQKYFEAFENFFYCGEKKYLFCDKKTLILMKDDPNAIKMAILLANYFIIEIKENVFKLKKFKNDSKIKLTRLILDSNHTSNISNTTEKYNSDNLSDDLDAVKYSKDSIENFNSEIKKHRDDLLEIRNFKKFLKCFKNKE
ncbi:hypothetical protein QLL95_gp0249 [Cotonvirus japonicus]|uniref:Uncharacterized protein n=1 Tax=Cotonvirus japonicus TaxID=2811091 RepID=A0ABM7NRE9_9VIRU|nr:hypothetical protein QLL95_gp0249 [Cotonvirus japonicus]BCS82738.1 hypothetical protein [Cotonvirus japonicus]